MSRLRFRCMFAALLPLLTWVGPAIISAQEKPLQKPEKYALLIGATKYRAAALNQPALAFPEADATALGELLKQTVRDAKDADGKALLDDKQQPLVEPNPEDLIALSELLTALQQSPAGSRVLLADCSRYIANRRRGPSFGTSLQPKDVPENMAILFACSEKEQSFEHPDWGHGAFTKCLLDELRDMAITGEMETSQEDIEQKATPLLKKLGEKP